MDYRILIVEDDAGISEGIARLCHQWGMEPVRIRDFSRVTEEFTAAQPHLVLMDISLPFMGGYHWCAEIRRVSNVPIIFISSAAEGMNIVMAMNMGGDDFITKPFEGAVLMAKIQAMLRRSYNYAQKQPDTLRHAGVALNLSDHTVTVNGSRLTLTRNEYLLLLTLMRNHGQVVSRRKLMEALWASDCYIDENTLTVNVNRLRKTLAGAGLTDLITTRFGEGYLIP